jgi:hypothetical protein
MIMGIELNADIFEDEVVKSDIPVTVDSRGPQCRPLPGLEARSGKTG